MSPIHYEGLLCQGSLENDAINVINDIALNLINCVVPENIYPSQTEGIVLNTPTLWSFSLSFVHLFKFFGLLDSLLPRKFQSLLFGVWRFYESRLLYLIIIINYKLIKFDIIQS